MDTHIPENVVLDGIRRFGRKFMLISSNKKRGYVGYCTACGGVHYGLDKAPDEKEKHHLMYGCSAFDWYNMICPTCGAIVEQRKGGLSRSFIEDRLHIMEWKTVDFNKVLLYECKIQLKNWQDWQNYTATGGASDVAVWDERITTLTSGNVEMMQYRYDWFSEYWAKVNVARTGDKNRYRDCISGVETLQNSFLANMSQLAGDTAKIDMVLRFVEEPITELFYKAGFYQIARDRLYKNKPTAGTRHIDFTQRSPKKMFRGLKKNNADQKMKQLIKLVTRKTTIDTDLLEASACFFRDNKNVKPETLAAYIDVDHDAKEGLKLYKQVSTFPFERYADYITNHEIPIYRDYLRLAEEMGAPLTERKTAFPEDLHAVHDALVKRKKVLINKAMREKGEKRYKQLIRQGFQFESKGICAIVPTTPDAIKDEGKALQHCVGRYAEKHVDGKTNIIFIRKADDINTPWFTLEVEPESLRFVQCYGFKNEVSGFKQNYSQRQYNKDVADFLKRYEAHLNRCRQKKGDKTGCRKTA